QSPSRECPYIRTGWRGCQAGKSEKIRRKELSAVTGPRLSIIPAGAIFDRTLEPRDLHVLNLLGCHTDKAGWCRRSQVRMAAELGCSRSSVQRSLDRLCEAGWVQKK